MTLTLELPAIIGITPRPKPVPSAQPRQRPTGPRFNWHILTLDRPYEPVTGTIVAHLDIKGALRGLLLAQRKPKTNSKQTLHFRIQQPAGQEISYAEGSFARSIAALVLRQNADRKKRQERLQLRDLPPALIPITQYEVLIAQDNNRYRKENGFSIGFSHDIDWPNEDQLLEQARGSVSYRTSPTPIKWSARPRKTAQSIINSWGTLRKGPSGLTAPKVSVQST